MLITRIIASNLSLLASSCVYYMAVSGRNGVSPRTPSLVTKSPHLVETTSPSGTKQRRYLIPFSCNALWLFGNLLSVICNVLCVVCYLLLGVRVTSNIYYITITRNALRVACNALCLVRYGESNS